MGRLAVEADTQLPFAGLPYCRNCAAILKALLAAFDSGDPFEVRQEHVIRVPKVEYPHSPNYGGTYKPVDFDSR